MFSKTITSAQQYANAGMGEEWVRTYLSSMDKEMPGYLQNLKKEKQNSQYAFVFAGNDEYSYFWNNFGKNFQR